MHVLIIHPEARYFGGAEKMLGYFLAAVPTDSFQVTVAVAAESRVSSLIPARMNLAHVHDTTHFSPRLVWETAGIVKKLHRDRPIDVVHAWAARDWELASAAAWRCGCRAVGTLHDHPQSSYISRSRQTLMRWCANHGLDRIVCVSDAVRVACERAGYRPGKLLTVHNGLPESERANPPLRSEEACRIGFLGSFSRNKGLPDLFRIIDGLSAQSPEGWELKLGGGAQDSEGERMLSELRTQYEKRPWWNRVHWVGWVSDPVAFLGSLDLLIFPSIEFDSFPTVLLEAGLVGTPVLAANVGGVPEILINRGTGWLFEPGDIDLAVDLLGEAISDRKRMSVVGNAGREHVRSRFSVGKMVANYELIYSNLTPDV